MIKLTQQELDALVIPLNWVLIKPNEGYNAVTVNKGTDQEMMFGLDIKFNPGENSAVYGEVVKVPSVVNNCSWESQRFDLKVGDMACYNYLSAMNAFGMLGAEKTTVTRGIIVDDIPYIFVYYREIFVIEREGEIIPMNGYCLGTMLQREFDVSSILVVPKAFQGKSNYYCTVTHLGAMNVSYDTPEMDTPVEKGEMVMLDIHADIPLEYSMHKRVGGGSESFVRFQRKDIMCVLDSQPSEI